MKTRCVTQAPQHPRVGIAARHHAIPAVPQFTIRAQTGPQILHINLRERAAIGFARDLLVNRDGDERARDILGAVTVFVRRNRSMGKLMDAVRVRERLQMPDGDWRER